MDYGAPYVAAFYQGNPIADPIESFKYSSSEDDDEDAEFNIRTDNRLAVDLPQYQEGAIWTVVWGYIGGLKSHVRKLYCYEVKPEFDDQNILITICFNEKGLTTKQRSDTRKIYTNTNMVEVAHTIGKAHGLKTSIELINQNQEPIKIITSDELVASLKSFSKKINDKKAADKKLFGSTDEELFQAFADGADISIENELQNRQLVRDLMSSFAMNANIVQGGKSDKQLLDEMGHRQPGGQFIADTTDDEMVIRRRNFNQTPVRSYKWAGGEGDLQAFQPESKNRSKDGTAVNMQYDGWDPLNKTFYTGDSNVTLSDETNKTLSKYEKQLKELSTKDENIILGNYAHIIEGGLSHDATNVVKVIPVPYTILDKKKALENTINYFKNPDSFNKPISDPTLTTPTQSSNMANNWRDEANLKNNPGYIEAIGDPTITKGKIITVMGVGKKYSGNYYITKVEHNIDGQKAYTIHMDIVRQGHNIKTNSSYVSNEETNKILNKEIGPDESKPKTKKLKLIKNP